MGPTEFKLLQFFMTHPERAYTRGQLLDQVWGANVLCRGAHDRRPYPPAAQGTAGTAGRLQQPHPDSEGNGLPVSPRGEWP